MEQPFVPAKNVFVTWPTLLASVSSGWTLEFRFTRVADAGSVAHG
jgi:hypothetical protein